MRPTRIGELVVEAFAAALATWLILHAVYSSLPALPRTAPFALFAGAYGEWLLATNLRARLTGKPGTRPVPPLLAVRAAALAKASSVVGAVAAGVWLGVLVFVVPALDVAAHRRDALTAGIGLAAAVAFLVTGLRLERVCRVPEDP